MAEGKDHLVIAWAWWGHAIALAIDGDGESRTQLAEATGVPDSYQLFAKIGDAGMDPVETWTETLTMFAGDPDRVDAARSAHAEPDEILTPAAEYIMRIIRGALTGHPACLPR